MSNTISNMEDVIDSRDIIARIEELTDERDTLQNEYEEALAALETEEATGNKDYDNDPLYQLRSNQIDTREALDNWNNSEDAKELKTLFDLAEECADYASDWEYGEHLIRRSYFEEYMDQMIEDCYTLPKDMPFWMSIKLDYKALEMDYTSVDFEGVEYLIRSA